MVINDMLRFILPEVAGCPDPMAAQAITQSAFEFFNQSGSWMVTHSGIAITASESEYPIPAVTDAIALRVRDLWIDGQRWSPDPLRESPAALTYHAASGQSVVLASPKDGEMSLRVVYAPTATASTLPEPMASAYMDAIVSGAKSRLMVMPGVAWSNPALSSFYASRFSAGVFDARSDVEHNHAHGSLRVVARRFA